MEYRGIDGIPVSRSTGLPSSDRRVERVVSCRNYSGFRTKCKKIFFVFDVCRIFLQNCLMETKMKKHIVLLSLLLGSLPACEPEGIDLPDAWVADPSPGSKALPDRGPAPNPSVALDAGISQTEIADARTASSLDSQGDGSATQSKPDLLPSIQPDLAPPAKLPLGTACGKSNECLSGFCTDGYCCGVSTCLDSCIAAAISPACPYAYAYSCSCGSAGSCSCH